jgi:hypothetical protein
VWEVEYTDEFGAWWESLTQEQQDTVTDAVEALQLHGPALGRPFVDTIRSSKHRNMKELRPRRGNIRILFAFDPRRIALLLIGGDKTGRWKEWYQRMLPVADRLYDEHLQSLPAAGESE